MQMRQHCLWNRKTVVLIIISTLGFSVSGRSQQQKSAAGGKSAFSLTIQAKDHIVKAGLPVWVDVTEKNDSNQILPFGREKPLSMDQGGESFWVDVWNDEGVRPTETTFYRKKLGHLTPEERAEAELRISNASFIILKPGEARTDRIDVGRLYDLRRPGTYTIQVQFPIQSNRITVTVIP
jgi:hypothetical protein